MARPKKPVNFSEERSKIEAKITHHKNSIKELEQDLLELTKKEEEQEISRLYETYKSSGMKIEELVSIIEQSPKSPLS